jgi:uncharacterized Zn finger protein
MPSYYNSYGAYGRQGIKATAKRGDFGHGWLARAWCDLIDRLGQFSGAQRGRSLARGQAVQSITVQPGIISGFVADYALYQTLIELPVLRVEQWHRLISSIHTNPTVLAQLLSGQVTADLGALAVAAHVPLLPTGMGMFEVQCGCYDWNDPCKHICAVMYLVGEEFDRDPLACLAFRGMEHGDLIARLSAGEPAEAGSMPAADSIAMPAAPDALTAASAAFWHGTPLPDALRAAEVPPPEPALPFAPFPFWAGMRSITDGLGPIYAKAASDAAAILGTQPALAAGDDPTAT